MNFTIPGKPPTENHMYHSRVGKHGQRMGIYKADAKAWFNRARMAAEKAAALNEWTPPEKNIWIVVKIFFYFPNRSHPDPSNCLKAFLDALEGPIYVNDKWVLPQVIGVGFDKVNPRSEVEVVVQEE